MSKFEHKKLLPFSTLPFNSPTLKNKMSALSFSFRPELIPAYAQGEFLTRFFQLVLDYQILLAPVPEAPSAESLPQPSAFAPVAGDEAPPAPAAEKPKKERKNPWANLSEEQRKERLDAMKRGRAAKAAERRQSADSLEAAAPAPPVPVAPLVADAEPLPARTPNNGGANAPLPVDSDAASDSSSKKARKNPWESYTPEQKLERLAKMAAARKAKMEAKLAASAEGSA